MLDRATHKPNPTGTVGWAGSTFGPLHKSRLGEHEFEALMRTLDNLVREYKTSQAPIRSIAQGFTKPDHEHIYIWEVINMELQ